MGCGNSSQTTVRPLTAGELNGDQDETGSKVGGRGDSAVSKGTTDSGVVMENREIPHLPGEVSTQLPPPTSDTVRDDEVNRIAQDCLLRRDSTVQERPKSSEILEELLNQGIIPVGQSREKSSGAPEAYSIMLDDREGVRRRPPARLESLKAKKAQSLHSREEIDEKMRLAEERRKSREDKLKTRLRTKSARVRGPAPISSVGEDEDASFTPVEPLRSPLIPDAAPTPPHESQIEREAAEGGEWVRQAGSDGRDERRGEGGGERGDNRAEGAERGSEELTQVEELTAGQLLSASGELESDSSFQHVEDKDEIF
ncbi:stathmin domain-containing protein 1 [Acanthochromis polyacanthus]|uniref:stathmin domain-containing protein 1 n=1 Tax=Acanthochromis polyacanthus TaxID=80966 RepID=UPI002234AC80|nr:stathmin domain-containing protein 1 [Acanthochromis polyacanthus]